VVKKGDTVDVVILNIDADNKRISLGLKQATEDPWLRIGETYPVGTEVSGRIVRFQDNDVVVDIGDDIEGIVPQNQAAIPDGQPPQAVLKEGQEADLKVLEVDPIHHRIVLAATGFREAPAGTAEPAESKAEEPGQ
jgi:small subunit ribosomal protein S1